MVEMLKSINVLAKELKLSRIVIGYDTNIRHNAGTKYEITEASLSVVKWIQAFEGYTKSDRRQ